MEQIADYNFIQKIGELTEDGIAVYDSRLNKFVYVNSNFLDIFEMKQGPDLLFGSSLTILKYVLSEDFEYLKSRFQELIEKGCINTTEFRLKFPDDSIKHLSCDVLILDNSDLVTAFVKDVTKTKLHEDYLIKYTAQKDTMLDMLTHNLSGPLLLSKDVISSLQDGINQNNETHVRKLISIIQENTQQCIDIVNDFLREEHHESARTYVKKTRFDIMEKINVTLDKLRAMNDDKTFKVSSHLHNLNINSDPVKFFQVIHNILSNSIKFTRPGGEIAIEVSENESDYIICLKDNGIGIPDSIKPSIFKEKYIGRTGLKGEKSSGLGLSIAKRLVTLMGGEIWFESLEDYGSSFFLKLPKE
ncbi:hypothetical protein CNR22_04680 [Sphingobacteriaceae bacterium]|nr:hypothetical protein CNR22_04680 [Sphingobacteriaceae bacterium]